MAEYPFMQIAKPLNVEVTLSWTLTLEQWVKLQRELNHVWPGSDLADAIQALVRKMSDKIEVSE